MLYFAAAIKDVVRAWYHTDVALRAGKLRILVFSGDADFIVNFLGSQAWVTAMAPPACSKPPSSFRIARSECTHR